jgi:hypothetical protein
MTKGQTHTARVGFVVERQLDEIRLLHPDRITGGALGVMRFGWIAGAINRDPDYRLLYELYRPWRRYDLILFVKAMGEKAERLLARQRRRGGLTVFDANVNYYEKQGPLHCADMAPTERQRQDAISMTSGCHGAIADSEFLLERCKRHNPNACWIPDNVNMQLVPPSCKRRFLDGRLVLLWSGQAAKLFELLVISDVLQAMANHIRLVLVTNSLEATRRWPEATRQDFDRMLAAVPHTIVPFTDVADLLRIYAQGGIIISPRFLDNTYNLGHTEWKITLGMACGCMALCSPQPSYVTVRDRAGGAGIRVCADDDAWRSCLETALGNGFDWDAEESAARNVVAGYYATDVVAKQHAAFVRGVMGGAM